MASRGLAGFFGKLSITVKLTLAAVLVNLAGLAASLHFLDRTAEKSFHDLALEAWVMRSGQIAAAAAGGIAWKSPDVVADAYSPYAQGDNDDLLRFVAFDVSGGEVAAYAKAGQDSSAVDPVMRELLARKPDETAVRRLAGTVVMLAPAGKDKAGVPIGYVGLAWNTGKVESIRSTLHFQNLAIQTISTVALMLIVFLTARMLVGAPLGAITKRVDGLSAGDTATPVAHLERDDEIGVIARAFEGVRAATLDKLSAGKAIEAEHAAIEIQRQEKDNARAAAAKLQAAVVRLIAAALARVAEGDLTARLRVEFPRDYQKLKEDFNLAMDRLQDTMSRIVATGGQVRTGTAEIYRAADELARRTEQQAVSVEETVAAFKDVARSLSETANGVGQARSVVEAVTVDAGRSDEVVGQAIAAMGGIEKSSQEINKIVGVIDEIAFQTNLLALNAGVEAARAGDAGRGFVVVAQEVRTLAQRSAEAAKEIKALISASAGQVKNGTRLVAETGEAIGRITGKVGNISAIVTAIARSANEQATGLRGINTAMNAIGTTTQQNAATADQVTTASHGLAQESQTLAELIGHFRTDAPEGRTVQDNFPRGPQAEAPARLRMPSTYGATALSLDAPQRAEDGWQEF